MNEEKQITPMAWAVKGIDGGVLIHANKPYKDDEYWASLTDILQRDLEEVYGYRSRCAGDSLPVDQPTPLYTLEQAREILTAEYNAKINKQC